MKDVGNALASIATILKAALPAIPVGAQDRAKIDAALATVEAGAEALQGGAGVAVTVKRSDVAAAVALALPGEVAKQLSALLPHA